MKGESIQLRSFQNENSDTQFSDLTMNARNIGWDGCNLIKVLDKRNPRRKYRVNIRYNNIYDDIKMRIIMSALNAANVEVFNLTLGGTVQSSLKYLADGLKYSSITSLSLQCENGIESSGLKYLANILKDTCITHLDLFDCKIGDDGLKCLAEGFRNTNIVDLGLESNEIKVDGIRYLTDVLPHTSIISLDLGDPFNYSPNEIGDEGIRHLAKCLKNTNITHLDLESNEITNTGMYYLTENLKDTCITSLSLKRNKINDAGIDNLVRILEDTQIIEIKYYECIDKCTTKTKMTEILSRNESKASKIKDIFQKLIGQDIETSDLEFSAPSENKNYELEEYSYIVKMITENPNTKGHIFDLIMKNRCYNYPDIIRKVNEFIPMILTKFQKFIDNNMPKLVTLFGSYDFVKLVEQFENMGSHEVVKNLLLHRVLYYVDDNSEILHPYIYKLLNEYSMPLYNEDLEPDKKEKIISFFKNHQEIDGAQELIDLLTPKSS